MSSDHKDYSAHSIKVMEGLEAVRMRPGMYIGTTDSKGLHHLIYEVVDNSIDESLAGHCDTITITLKIDGSCLIEDNGRGIPTDIHPTENISATEVVLTKLHAGGKFDKDSYAFSGGLHGVGVSVVNALAQWLKVTIYQHGSIYYQEYTTGIPSFPLKIIGTTERRGTSIQFFPDPSVFKQTIEFNFNTLNKRFQEMAYLNKGLAISIIDERTNDNVFYSYDKGIVSFVNHLNEGKELLFDDVIYHKYCEKTLEVEFALQYNSGYDEELISFVNNINTHEGGTHVSGFKSAFTSACNKKGRDFNILKKEENFSSEDVREGLVCILSIKVAEPQFEGQTKAKLGNFDIKGLIHSIAFSFFDTYFEENPHIAKKILAKAELAQKAREAAKRARELTRKKNIFESTVLPGKLADCSSDDPVINELFIVEGNSAGGSAKTARERSNQAILPLRGKIINVEKAIMEKILANEEIKSLIAAIGSGFGNETCNISTCRYHKIIIMADADVDGSHIRTLLLTFFFRYLKPLIEEGYLYIAQPPLYKVKIGKHDRYMNNDKDLISLIISWVESEIKILKDNNPLSLHSQKELLKSTLDFFNLINELSYLINKRIKDIETLCYNEGINGGNSFTVEQLFIYQKLCDIVKEQGGWQSISLLSNHNKELGLMTHNSFLDLLDLIKIASKPYMNIQRYKGLGEMNAEQLWETAMDPDKRQLLRVDIKDAQLADYWFTVLMGEDITERKIFIESRAHFVKNLDV